MNAGTAIVVVGLAACVVVAMVFAPPAAIASVAYVAVIGIVFWGLTR